MKQQISPLLPSFHTEAVTPICLRGPPPGSPLWPLPSEVGTLPSTHRKVKGKGKLKAKPKAEAYPVKRLSLPEPPPFTDTFQRLGMWEL